jgi:Leucine-rich repeat (LRR) protein
MPINNCQTFKQKIEEIKEKAKILENLLIEYKNTGNEEIAEEIDRILQEIEEFKKEYEEKVKELMAKWYPYKYSPYAIKDFIERIKINERGRLELHILDLDMCNLKGEFYLPLLFERIDKIDLKDNALTSISRLPEKIEQLGCENNLLESLPELPEGLKYLYVSGNQLTSLPKLPQTLEVLSCSFNRNLRELPDLPPNLKIFSGEGCPFTKQTIQKIKSHPNYNPQNFDLGERYKKPNIIVRFIRKIFRKIFSP